MIEIHGLSKHYGKKVAVDDVTFTVRPGAVTGFLGPNGAGKSTTMRIVLGLGRPTSGTATVNGRTFRDHTAPLREVGSLLEAKAVHTGRSAYNHLLAMAATTGIPRRRVDEVIDLVGLHEVANKRPGGFSLGMGQRLGIASALLGDPRVLLLDEPVNGLDPDGVLWIRNLLNSLAAEGRTVFVSSHLLSEMALTAEHLIVIGRGKIIADCSTTEFIDRASRDSVQVRSPEIARLRDILARLRDVLAIPDVTITAHGVGTIHVTGLSSDRIGEIAAGAGITLHELSPQQASLEQAFMELTQEAVEYHAAAPARQKDVS